MFVAWSMFCYFLYFLVSIFGDCYPVLWIPFDNYWAQHYMLKCLYPWKWWKTRLTVGIYTATLTAFTSIEVCPREDEKWSKLISVNVHAARDLLHCLSPDVCPLSDFLFTSNSSCCRSTVILTTGSPVRMCTRTYARAHARTHTHTHTHTHLCWGYITRKYWRL